VLFFFINTGFVIWAVRGRGISGARGVGAGVLYETSCGSIKRANIGVHVAINILSSTLLGASNYCMQCVAAPNRSEVDRAHRKGGWLDIGIPSLRNVVTPNIGMGKKICWWILALSSLPPYLW
jgi:hypothetical protein